MGRKNTFLLAFWRLGVSIVVELNESYNDRERSSITSVFLMPYLSFDSKHLMMPYHTFIENKNHSFLLK